MSGISFSTVHAESVQFGTIFKYCDCLCDLSLLPGELEAFPWASAESWPEFLEKCLRPMIYYYLHAAVTHDFTLVAPKGHYFSGEKAEILEWLEEVLLHCRLILLSLFPPITKFLDDVKILLPEPWEVPGEATAMFGILYRICSSLDFTDIPGALFLSPFKRHIFSGERMERPRGFQESAHINLLFAGRPVSNLLELGFIRFPSFDAADVADNFDFRNGEEQFLGVKRAAGMSDPLTDPIDVDEMFPDHLIPLF
ncbi:hypothetical protein B0H11DRAFT_2250296 [Mycena galericulata]|nr:hypothetical protein B0H11DRAFT_2250296 [Mycena galericulata]